MVLGEEPMGQVVASMPVAQHDSFPPSTCSEPILVDGGPGFRISQSTQPEFSLEIVVLKVKKPADSSSRSSGDSNNGRKWVR